METVDEYLAGFPDDVRAVLARIRQAIPRAVPGAGEKISYQIPTFTLDGRDFVYVAGWKRHVSVYPVPETDESLAAELAPYRAAKGTLRFPLDRPVPYGLIERVAALLAAQRGAS